MEKVGSNNLISFVARHASVDIHYHQCLQVVVSLDAPFDSVIDGIGYSCMNGFLINQTITHSCKAENTEVLIFFIDAESYQGWQLKEMLDGRPFVPINSILTEQELNEIIAQYGRAAGLAELQQTADDLMAMILRPRQEPAGRNIDERVAKAIEYISLNLDNPLALADIAGQVFLSPERLRHLFAQETGIPFSQYVLWKRIKLVMTQVISDKLPMANAAIQNGFTDQAHFTRLFKRTFGVNAGSLLKNSRFVQFLTPEV
jgi:AraC-like DNA-binding protein